MQVEYNQIISFIYPSIFFVSTALVSYPLWTKSMKNTGMMSVIWVLAVFYAPICIVFFQVISNFNKFQLMTFMLNFIVLATIMRWQAVILMLLVRILSTTQFFKYCLSSSISC